MKKRKRPPDPRQVSDQAEYDCPSCGELIVIAIDFTAGSAQTYFEECPSCCRPSRVHVELDETNGPRVWVEPD